MIVQILPQIEDRNSGAAPAIENRPSQISNLKSEIHLCSLDDLPLGLGRAFEIQGRTIALFRTRTGKVFAFDNQCPHKQGPLSEGMLAGDSVVCPLHAFRFDMNTGDCDQPNTCALKTHPVELRNNEVFIQLT
ncbi:MAG TPA: nitrite reductase small subunit NirD [Phycisphaerae bacterium]|nr:nitrite reductase small subunit NirD [Phycisphaerae bacterium]